MERTNISNLKNRLSAILKKVRAGETVLVLDRNRPIARIERVSGPGASDERLSRLEAAGLIRRPTRAVPINLLRKDRPKSRESVLTALLEERSEGR